MLLRLQDLALNWSDFIRQTTLPYANRSSPMPISGSDMGLCDLSTSFCSVCSIISNDGSIGMLSEEEAVVE
jgi:hypothetical protein